jgi:hypothetical protein
MQGLKLKSSHRVVHPEDLWVEIIIILTEFWHKFQNKEECYNRPLGGVCGQSKETHQEINIVYCPMCDMDLWAGSVLMHTILE